jgi:uncharacterized protein
MVGRVRNYTRRRHIWERLQVRLTSSGWPARVARLLGRPASIATLNFTIELPIAAPPLKIAFASDFHAGATTRPDVLAHACQRLQEAAPDVLLLGGDFVCLDAGYVDTIVDDLASIPAPLGRYAVLGNHDLWVDYQYIERRLEAGGIELLTNRNVRLAPPYDRIWLCGLDDHWSGSPNARAAFRGADGIRVVLMHQPSGLLDLNGERFDLAFCGHTHGGQIALPGGYPMVVPEGKLSRKYPAGRYDLLTGGTLLVSRGVGCSTIPFRMFSPPEITVCTLVTT